MLRFRFNRVSERGPEAMLLVTYPLNAIDFVFYGAAH